MQNATISINERVNNNRIVIERVAIDTIFLSKATEFPDIFDVSHRDVPTHSGERNITNPLLRKDFCFPLFSLFNTFTG